MLAVLKYKIHPTTIRDQWISVGIAVHVRDRSSTVWSLDISFKLTDNVSPPKDVLQTFQPS